MRTARDAEYDVVSRVTALLRHADRYGRTAASVHAVLKNSELWTLLASDLAGSGNNLPEDVKAGLISLAGFSIRHGQDVLWGGATTDPLIDVNMMVLKGLRGEAGA